MHTQQLGMCVIFLDFPHLNGASYHSQVGTQYVKRAGAYTTRVPLGSIDSSFYIVLATLNKRAYARCEMYAQLPGVKPTDVPD